MGCQAFSHNRVASVLSALDANFRNDAGETASFARALEYVEAEVRQKIYPELMALKLVPVKAGIPADAASFTWRMWDWAGIAKIVANYSDDLPRVDVKAGEQIVPIRSMGASYAYALQELRESQRTGLPLDTVRAMLARRAIMNLVEQLFAIGDSKVGLTGLVNNANVTTIVPGGGFTGGWTGAATSDQILADLHFMANAIVTSTNGAIIPDTMVLPVNRYSVVATKKMNANTEATVMSEFMKNTPYIKNIGQWHQLDTAASGNPKVLTFKRDPEICEGILPVDYEALPPQAKNLMFDVPVHGRCGGVVVYQPMGMRYATGI